MKKNILLIAAIILASNIYAQYSIKENFESNSMGWSECTFDNKENIKMFIDKGVLTIHSERNTNIWAGTVTYSFAESSCYVPLNMMKPFKIITHFRYTNDEALCGIMFNEKDNGTYYALAFDEDNKKVYFQRVVDNNIVGGHTQGFPFPKLRKGEWYELVIIYDGQTIEAILQDIPVFSLRYMPLEYAGFGFFTRGEQEMIVDDIEFIQ